MCWKSASRFLTASIVQKQALFLSSDDSATVAANLYIWSFYSKPTILGKTPTKAFSGFNIFHYFCLQFSHYFPAWASLNNTFFYPLPLFLFLWAGEGDGADLSICWGTGLFWVHVFPEGRPAEEAVDSVWAFAPDPAQLRAPTYTTSCPKDVRFRCCLHPRCLAGKNSTGICVHCC